MPRKKLTNSPVQVTDLSHEVPGTSADENNHARTRVAGFNKELEQAHRKIAELERNLQRSAARIDTLRFHLRRRKWALLTGFVTLTGKAGYAMATTEVGGQQWWLNCAQAAGLLLTAGYLIAPNVRRLLRMSSETAEPEDNR